jgi:hypothetical protein
VTIKDPQGTLRRIDDQIMQHNQNIARSRLEIARLQETRIVIMGLVEEDIFVAQQAKEERAGIANGAHAVPKLIVRPTGYDEVFGEHVTGGDEQGHAAPAEGMNKAGNLRGMKQPRKSRRPSEELPRDEQLEPMRERVLTAIKTHGAMDTHDVRKALGLANEHHKSRKVKVLYNAIYSLRTQGKLTRDDSDFTLRLAGH